VVPTPASNAAQAALLPTTVNALPFMDVATFRELLGQLKGTPVVVNVWASWCIPCKSEAPMLSAAARAHPDVQFVGVDILDSRSGALGFLTTYAIPYPSVLDPSAAIKVDLGASGQPDTFFFDANGTQATEVLGILSQTSLDAGLAKIATA
jgi:cytochrome c biogenesis protein CcmG, thiol:disulfide interchange protein DsbE